MHASGRAAVALLSRHLNFGHHLSLVHHLSLGGAGLGRLLVHLFIWHEIGRLVRALWRIPTFGPFIVIALAVVIVGLLVWRQVRRPAWGRRRGGSAGYGTGRGPRDW